MKRLSDLRAALIGVLALTMTPSSASATDLLFGPDEKFHDIEAVRIDGEVYDLAHKTTIYFFGAGAFLTDDGYVLHLRDSGEEELYIPLDRGDIAALQASGDLPNPLPDYSVPFVDYLMGYSLWIAIAVAVIATVVGNRRAARRRSRRTDALLSDPTYLEALRIAREPDGEGVNGAVDYLLDRGIPLEEAHADMQLLLAHDEALAA